MQRARLIVNPHATTTSPRARDVLTQAVASVVSLEITETKARGHAAELAFDAAGAGSTSCSSSAATAPSTRS